MRVLHICTEKNWRGGENQIRLFIEGSQVKGITNFVAVPFGGRTYDKFSKMVETVPLVSKSGSSPISIWRLYKFCKAHEVQLLDAQGSGGLSLALWVKKFIPDLKIVAHRRVDIAVAKDFFSRRKYLSDQINRMVAISKKIKQTLVECGISESKITVVPSAVESSIYKNINREQERAKLLQQFNLPSHTLLIGNASALVETKGNQFLIFALPEILKKVKTPVHIFLAGEGSQRGRLEGYVREAGLQSHVTFLGHIDSVPNFLSGLDIMAMPSMSEGLGSIILDAISARTVVTASDVGGIPEMIIHNETGLLFKAGDVESLTINLIRLIEDKELRETLKFHALKHLEANFSLNNMIDGNIAIYKDLMFKSPD